MQIIKSKEVSITTTGSAGSATGSGTLDDIHGFLLDVYLNYHASCPATADVTIADSVFGNALVVSNSATDAWYAPRKATCDAAAAATGSYDLIPLDGKLTISVAQADALTDCLIATVRWLVL